MYIAEIGRSFFLWIISRCAFIFCLKLLTSYCFLGIQRAIVLQFMIFIGAFDVSLHILDGIP